MKIYNVCVIGATGTVGQMFVKLLENHPWFKLTRLFASRDSAFQTYQSAMQNKWRQTTPIPAEFAQIEVEVIDKNFVKGDLNIVFSALDSSVAEDIEPYLAALGLAVFSNAAAYRNHQHVPIIIPEINPHHFEAIRSQEFDPSNKGFIVTNPNCTLQAAALPLFPLLKLGAIDKVIVTSMQALSGAGYPGVPSLDIIGNVIPYIAQNEESKIADELHKIFGVFDKKTKVFDDYGFSVSASCNRVPVLNGHTLSVNFSICNDTPIELFEIDIIDLWENFTPDLGLPSAQKPVIYMKESNRPQPLLDQMAGNGMTVSIGNLRRCNVLDWKFTSLLNNTVRGAAGGSMLNAELWVQKFDQ
jgi:aspartate-semialdehyde dehydrogenase